MRVCNGFKKTDWSDKNERQIIHEEAPGRSGWQIGNEYLLGADLPGLAHPQVPRPESQNPRMAADKFTLPMMLDLYRDLHRTIREIVPYRMIATGDAMPSKGAWNNRHRDDGGIDTRQQWLEMFTADTPEVFSVSSDHSYPENSGYFKGEQVGLEELLREVARE